MATLVQEKNTADSSFASVTFDSNVSADNLGIVTVRVGTGDGTITAITDSRSSTWAKVGASQSISGGTLEVWWTVFPSSGANTISLTGATARITAEEINGLGAGATLDQNNAATGTSSSPSSGSITTTAATWIHCGLGMTNYPSVAPTVGSGWTAQVNAGNKYSTEHRNETSSGTFTGNWTLPESNTWAAIVAAFKSAGGATGTKTALLLTGVG